ERQLQRRLHALLNAGFRWHVQNSRLFQQAWRITGGQMISPRRFAQAALTQARLAYQLTRQLQYVLDFTFQQFELQLANRLLKLARFYLTLIEGDFNAAFPFRYQPFFTPEIGAKQRFHLGG